MEVDFFECRQTVDRRARLELRKSLTADQRNVLGQFGEEYFDGATGYGGYHYDGRHAKAAAKMIAKYSLVENSRVLDVGCAKGFVVREFQKLGIQHAYGCDVSAYAIDQAHPEVKSNLSMMSADSLDYPDSSFDLVFSLDVIHNLAPTACDRAITEMKRVSRGHCFLQVASYYDAAQLERLRDWGVTVQTFRSQSEWLQAFSRIGYTGDYCFKTF